MSIFNKNFFLGATAGLVLSVVVVVGGFYGLMWWYTRGPSDRGTIPELGLDAPPFPAEVLADYDWTITSLDGEEFPVSAAKGKVIFLNFWATWCPPCVAEMPSIQRLYEQVQDDRLVFLCVSQEERSKVSRFVKEKNFTVPVYTLQGQPPAGFLGRGIPTTFIISPDGKVVFKHVGAAKWDDETSIAFLKGLLSGTS